jgi:hypothetical protein
MPTLPSVNHPREPLPVPAVPDPSIVHSSTTPATDPISIHSAFTGSVVGSISRRNRRSFAALAQRTSSALASLSTIATPTLHTSTSSSSLSKSKNSLTPPLSDDEQLSLWRPYSPDPPKRRLTLQRVPTPPQEHRLSGFAPILPPKMHQTSSRLLRMTEDERPFTKVGDTGMCRVARPLTWKKTAIE